jgi:hypothetical protein
VRTIPNSLEEAILKTLAYSSIFDYPLTVHEIHKFLIQKKTSLLSVKKALIAMKSVSQNKGYYYLNLKEDYTNRRNTLTKISNKKIKIAKRLGRLLSFIPTVQMIAVTGSLSMMNSKEDDDIDFLIIVSPGFLWITRLIVTLFLDFIGTRRKPKSKILKDKICLNMFLDNDHLHLPKNYQNLYSAHEVVQLKPIFSRKKTYENFLGENSWVLAFLPNSLSVNLIFRNRSTRCNEFLKKVIWPIETIVYFCQKRLMYKKITREVVNKHYIFFHPRDTKVQILGRYYKTLDMLK